ncbi:hypothetical protein VQ02_10240 [Methylobacterium variabile]|jgi:antitoxin HicB|uniref:HicB-like antitoxin of toxin-antitoxin system domain-containing protein n=1 Tax=Methylobacterium variabile TaxID=298794 RepID=A0A0J6VJK5_9HYPH|nr:type II toxin-antitoxin system HicB family antitoxin [Methylobacterium variabile]KMO39311.1 hypothetical protein VQ02_10240 [Methylobacterium variabile]
MVIFPICLTPDDNDTFLVTSPAFPEVTTFGETREDAIHQAGEAIEEAIGARISANGHLPIPLDPRESLPDCVDATVKLAPLTSLKALLYLRMRNADITRAELARRLGWNRESVDRLFRLDHRSRLEQLDAAFHVLGAEMVVDVHDAA